MMTDTRIRPDTLPLLISYWYFRNTDVEAWLNQFVHKPLVFADSGAFSAYSQNEVLDVGAYAEWLHKYKHLFAHYASLDVKDNVNEGLRNLAILETNRLKPLPVFHGGEDLGVLREMVGHGYPYIALGNIAGRVAGRANNTGAWLVECFRIAEGKSVFHGFGMTTPQNLWSLPWYSIDSSSWSAGFRYGAVAVYIRSERRIVYLRNVKREPQHRERWEKYKTDVAKHGQHIYDFMHHDIRSNVRYASVGAAAFSLMGQHLRETKKPVCWPGEADQPSNPGPTLYLAAQGLPPNAEKGTKGRAWYELDALHYLDDNLELYR